MIDMQLLEQKWKYVLAEVILVVVLILLLAILPRIGNKINEVEDTIVVVSTEEEFKEAV